ncbi:DNA polymerase I [Natronospora cellulosivora (SeqCode)]
MIVLSEKLFLLDGHSLTHRAFYALPLLQNSAGEYTNAVFGFSRMLFKLIEDEEPDYIIVAFDLKAPTFRHKEYSEYKGNRKKMPDELSPQIPLIKEFLKGLNIPIISKEGFEADDLIGTLAKKAESEGMQVRIVTGDRDALQLVSENINILYTRKGISDIVRYNVEKVKEKYQLEPWQLVDMKGLMGDSSDNIPGVPGIGEKTAIKLLKEFSSLENVLDNIEKVSGKKRKENLSEYSEQARLSKVLGEIVIDVPVDIDFSACALGEADHDSLIPLLERLEFNALLDKYRDNEELNIEDVSFQKLSKQEEIEDLIENIKKQGKLAFDFSLDNYKYPLQAKVNSFLIALDETKIYNIDFSNEVLAQFKDLFEDKKIEKYILHAKEAFILLKDRAYCLQNFVFDPLLASYLLNPSDKLPSLEEQVNKELNLVFDDDISAEKKNALILSKLYKLKEILEKKLEALDLLDLYKDIEIPLIKVLAELELNGICLDKEYLNTLSEKLSLELEDISAKIYELAGEEFNINSPKQLGVILFEKLALPVIKKTKTSYSTSAKVLEELEDKHEIIPLIINYRQLMKLKSTYVDALPPLINPETGRIHTSFNQMVTATGRLSSTDPNLQNIPIRTEEGREIRKCFVPAGEDWLLLAADYSQVELRVLAHISSDSNLLDAYKNGDDIHTQTASEVFEVPAEEVSSNMRRHAKVINFGIAYGMSSYGLARDLNISRAEADNYINKYFERFTSVKKYMDDIVEKAKEDGFVSTIFNRRRYVPEIKSRNFHRRSFAKRTAINTPIQGSAADIMKIAMIKVYETLEEKEYRARMLLQVHDELVLEVHRDDINEVAKILKYEMEKAVDLDVPLIADLQLGKNWRDKEEYIIK